MSKSYKHVGSDDSQQKLLSFQSIMISLLPKVSKRILVMLSGRCWPISNQVGLICPWAVQPDHFKLFLEKEPMRPRNLAEVYCGITLQNLCQKDVKWTQRLLCSHPLRISNNHVLIGENKLERKVASTLQDTWDTWKILRKLKKADSTRCSESHMSPNAIEKIFWLMTSLTSEARRWITRTNFEQIGYLILEWTQLGFVDLEKAIENGNHW